MAGGRSGWGTMSAQPASARANGKARSRRSLTDRHALEERTTVVVPVARGRLGGEVGPRVDGRLDRALEIEGAELDLGYGIARLPAADRPRVRDPVGDHGAAARAAVAEEGLVDDGAH